jgi:hypothetical protein
MSFEDVAGNDWGPHRTSCLVNQLASGIKWPTALDMHLLVIPAKFGTDIIVLILIEIPKKPLR